MRTDKYMERIILDELEVFKRKGNIAAEVVTEYVQSVENEVKHRVTYNIQSQYKELQEFLRESCQTLNRFIIGLATMAPSPDVNNSRQIEDVPRPMITSECLPATQWSSSDCSVRIDNERNSCSPSPDAAIDGNREAMVEPSSSSASSSSSATHAPYKARMMEILRKQRKRSGPEDDEFAMEIPEPTIKLNVDAPEFKPSTLDSKSSHSLTSTSSDADTAVQTRNTTETLPQKQCAPNGDLRLGAPPQFSDPSGQVARAEPNAQKAMTSSSSVESFLTASTADCDQNRNDERNSKQEIKSVAGYEIASSNGFGAGDNVDGLAPNSYADGVESRPSSLCTRNVIYDTEKVLRGTAKALREQAPNGFQEETGFCLPNRHATSHDADQQSKEAINGKGTPLSTQELTDRVDRLALQEMFFDTPEGVRNREQVVAEYYNEDREWLPPELFFDTEKFARRQTRGEAPPDVRKTRVPPLWNYVHVSFSDIDFETGKVYVQMLADELVISQLSDEMNAPSMSRPIAMKDISVDLLVIAPYQDVRYRAQIVSKESEDNIEVFFIDYGNKARVELQDLSVISSRKHTKTCRMAIPCVLDDALRSIPNLLEDLPDTAYVCLGNPSKVDKETVYRIMDVMTSTRENYRELPDPAAFSAVPDPSHFPYTVVISHATSPESMWLVEKKDLNVSQAIEKILDELPPEQCSRELVKQSVYVAFQGQRAMVLDRRGDFIDLLCIDTGRFLDHIPLLACRRLPLVVLTMPRAAKSARLANCNVPANRPGLGEQMMSPYIGQMFDMKKLNDETDEVILLAPETRKYLAKELKTKYGL